MIKLYNIRIRNPIDRAQQWLTLCLREVPLRSDPISKPGTDFSTDLKFAITVYFNVIFCIILYYFTLKKPSEGPRNYFYVPKILPQKVPLGSDTIFILFLRFLFIILIQNLNLEDFTEFSIENISKLCEDFGQLGH